MHASMYSSLQATARPPPRQLPFAVTISNVWIMWSRLSSYTLLEARAWQGEGVGVGL